MTADARGRVLCRLADLIEVGLTRAWQFALDRLKVGRRGSKG
jgi:hypothetical protein